MPCSTVRMTKLWAGVCYIYIWCDHKLLLQASKHACAVYKCCELRLSENLNLKYMHVYIHIARSLSYRATNSIRVGLHK